MSALARISFPSRILLKPVEIVAALPHYATPPYKVLWALHCAMEDGEYFFRYLDAARLCNHLNVSIVAPGLGNGFFINSGYEPQADFLEEIFAALPHILPVSSDCSRNAVLGISMGAFGAMRWALESSHFFAAAAISGAYDANLPLDKKVIDDAAQSLIKQTFDQLMRSRLTDFGGQLPHEGGLRKLVENHRGEWPELFLFCGENDYLSLNQTLNFYELCKENGAPVSLSMHKGGHDLEFWRWAFPLAVHSIFQGKN